MSAEDSASLPGCSRDTGTRHRKYRRGQAGHPQRHMPEERGQGCQGERPAQQARGPSQRANSWHTVPSPAPEDMDGLEQGPQSGGREQQGPSPHPAPPRKGQCWDASPPHDLECQGPIGILLRDPSSSSSSFSLGKGEPWQNCEESMPEEGGPALGRVRRGEGRCWQPAGLCRSLCLKSQVWADLTHSPTSVLRSLL